MDVFCIKEYFYFCEVSLGNFLEMFNFYKFESLILVFDCIVIVYFLILLCIILIKIILVYIFKLECLEWL